MNGDVEPQRTQIESLQSDDDPQRIAYLFDGPARYSSHNSLTVGIVRVPEFPGSKRPAEQRAPGRRRRFFLSNHHQLTSARRHLPQLPRTPVSLFAPTRHSQIHPHLICFLSIEYIQCFSLFLNPARGARLCGEQVSRPPSGSSCLAPTELTLGPAQPPQLVHRARTERLTKLDAGQSEGYTAVHDMEDLYQGRPACIRRPSAVMEPRVQICTSHISGIYVHRRSFRYPSRPSHAVRAIEYE